MDVDASEPAVSEGALHNISSFKQDRFEQRVQEGRTGSVGGDDNVAGMVDEVEEEYEEDVETTGDYQPPSQSSPIIEKFAGSAGEPVTSTSANANMAYQAALGSSLDPANPFSPFKSKLDWEVAEWAKLLGPSETSFTKLLAIDQVSDFLHCP